MECCKYALNVIYVVFFLRLVILQRTTRGVGGVGPGTCGVSGLLGAVELMAVVKYACALMQQCLGGGGSFITIRILPLAAAKRVYRTRGKKLIYIKGLQVLWSQKCTYTSHKECKHRDAYPDCWSLGRKKRVRLLGDVYSL